MSAVEEAPVRFGRSESASVLDTQAGVAAVSDDPKAWVVIEGESPPPGWADRAAEAWVVRLVPGEVKDVLTKKAARPVLDPVELAATLMPQIWGATN